VVVEPESPKSVALPFEAIVTYSAVFLPELPLYPLKNNPLVEEESELSPLTASERSPKSEALPVEPIVIFCITS